MNDLLYHADEILGQKFHQLVVPSCRIPKLLETVHNLTHSSARRLRQRLRYSFHFPRMKAITTKFVQTCDACQRKSRVTYRDRIPITAVERAPSAFEHFYADIFGPLCASSPLRHNYCIVCVDSMSRYVFALPMRTVTAQTVCDALISIFSHSSLPTTLSSDNGSVFSSKLNAEFLKRFGISPVFITPRHASADLAERYVGTLKSMLNRIAADHPQTWAQYLPLILWFLRETPCATT
mgnify:FL=1